MCNRNFADVGAKHVDNPKIYNIERDNRLSPGLQHLTTRYRVENPLHFRTNMEHNICRPVNNIDVSLGYQFCKNITFILYIIYNVRYNNIRDTRVDFANFFHIKLYNYCLFIMSKS
jgi:hypothetical protein